MLQDSITTPLASAMLDALFAGLDGHIEVRALPSRSRAWCRPGEYAALDTFLRLHDGENVYVGVALRRDTTTGTLVGCTFLQAFFVDIDFKDIPEADARGRLANCPCTPSIIISTGGGLHVYWLLYTPMDVQISEASVRSFLLRLCTYFDADRSCAEPARVLRLPDSKNHKYDPPRPVTVEVLEPNRRYSLFDFDTWLPALPTAPDGMAGGSFTVPEDICKGQRDAVLYRLGRSLKAKGVHRDAISTALHTVNDKQCRPPFSRREVDALANQVLEQADRFDLATSAGHGARARVVTLTAADTITVRPVRWLWQDRWACGSVGLLGGREGVGKSLVAYTLAAGITRGTLPGVACGIPRAVVVAATEDSWESTLVPRLMAAGADLSRVFRVDVTTSLGTDTTLSLPTDLDGLERVVQEAGAALVILDPLLSRLDSGLDTHKDAEVRRALEPIVRLADATGAFVLGLMHVNKSNAADALTLLMASRAFAAVARSVLFVAANPDDEAQRLLGLVKNNLGRLDLPCLTFEIEETVVASTEEGEVLTAKLKWTGESDRTIRDIIEAIAERAVDRTAVREAAEWLRDYLTNQGGCRDSATVLAEGSNAGHSRTAIERARTSLGVGYKSRGFPRQTDWFLPGSSYPIRPTAGGESGTGTTGITESQSYQSYQACQSLAPGESETTAGSPPDAGLGPPKAAARETATGCGEQPSRPEER